MSVVAARMWDISGGLIESVQSVFDCIQRVADHQNFAADFPFACLTWAGQQWYQSSIAPRRNIALSSTALRSERHSCQPLSFDHVFAIAVLVDYFILRDLIDLHTTVFHVHVLILLDAKASLQTFHLSCL